MKYVSLSILAVLAIGFSARAQFKKGMRLPGVSVGTVFFNTNSSDVSFPGGTAGYTTDMNSYGINLSPSYGVFLTDNLVAGLSLTIQPNGTKTTYKSAGSSFQEDKVNGTNLGLGVFGRDYLKSASQTLRPFIQLSLNGGPTMQKTSGYFYGGSGASAYKDVYDGKSSSGFYFNGTLGAGFTKLLSAHSGLDFQLSYTYSYNKNTYKRTTTRDNGNNGTIDLTSVSNPTTKLTGSNFGFSLGYIVLLDARK